jgi:hypothetical protein
MEDGKWLCPVLTTKKENKMLKKSFGVLIVSCCFLAFATAGFAQSPVTITEMTISKGIQDREPVDAGDLFPNNIGKLYCFTRSSASEETSIKHVWYREGEKRAELSFAIGVSPSWRTSSSKIIRPVDFGNWKVEVVGPDGEILKTVEFVVEK